MTQRKYLGLRPPEEIAMEFALKFPNEMPNDISDENFDQAYPLRLQLLISCGLKEADNLMANAKKTAKLIGEE